MDSGILPFVQPAGLRGTRFVNMEALKRLAIEAYENAEPHNKVGWK
jgi:hypothetical protein